ncbi:hypothetical protein M3Y94_00085400 [Aphelenchoides besseyi]|nr:hypothetical protein M3Y94_00085400 [Aphelenchoides besseyi]KAI6237740.1 hypothetical protein M3Y95_00296800 [Aphelenchoides besseyi]
MRFGFLLLIIFVEGRVDFWSQSYRTSCSVHNYKTVTECDGSKRAFDSHDQQLFRKYQLQQEAYRTQMSQARRDSQQKRERCPHLWSCSFDEWKSSRGFWSSSSFSRPQMPNFCRKKCQY